MFARSPRALSLGATVRIHEPFLKDIIELFCPILHFKISVRNIGDLGIISFWIFNNTSSACFLVLATATTLDPGYSTHLTTQKIAVKNVLESNVIICKLFILHSGDYSHFHRLVCPIQFGIYFYPTS